ncbi:trimeric intracellular cation channel family protein [Devosia sp. 919]|uniref:trimeric intracellular cation channel family protein n=1 Tax=Devosia sp. 919 TaxID=2726065 RepID=UPI0015564575|nr:trimeric intracellular cation channel family protein [Devosia sp. 919]
MLSLLSYVAIAAQAMTAALTAGQRSMDWFGVCVLACVTALGGGTVRDIVLGHYPLYWVANPYVLLLASGAALLTIALAQFVDRLRWPFLLLDALGLVVFTIIGCNVAMQSGSHPIIVLVSGMVTGIVGGVLRDVLCNDVPLVFRSELYATVSLATAAVYYLGLKAGLNAELVSVAAASFGFAFRVAALIWHWNMPKFVYDKDLR